MSTRIVVFDLDGTLVQARSAAWELFQETAEKFDLPIRSAEDFFSLFERSFFVSLDELCGDPVRAAEVRGHFLAALEERYNPRVVPGMTEVVKRLAPHYALAVMSSNAMRAIRRTLDDAGMATCFAHVFSADLEVSKRSQLRMLASDRSYANVRRCSESYVETEATPDGSDVVLVTDTVGDVVEGVASGARVIGVSWGMHGGDRLVRAGASFVARWPQELVAELLPGGSCRSGGCGCEQGTCSTTGACALRPALLTAVPTRTDRPSTDAAQHEAAQQRVVQVRLDRRADAVPHPAAVASPTPPSSQPSQPPRGCDGLTDAIRRISRSQGAPSR